jgi:hypothetical protein
MSRANPRTTHNNAGIAAWRFKLRGEVRSYEEAERFLKESPEWANGEPAAELGPHMTVQMHDTEPSDAVGADCYAVKLYNTEIIRYFPDGTFSVDCPLELVLLPAVFQMQDNTRPLTRQ